MCYTHDTAPEIARISKRLKPSTPKCLKTSLKEGDAGSSERGGGAPDGVCAVCDYG